MNSKYYINNDRAWFMSFCSEAEIDRILSPQNASDYLLQQRAEIVADNTRYLRVYMNKARIFPDWSFEKSFIDSHYLNVIKHLNEEDKLSCNNITFGDIFSNDANGYAENNKQWGKIVYLNECLQFYMKFCNLALLDFNGKVPDKIRMNALRIAIRIMMKCESMDFFLDPRGIVPEKIGKKMHNPIKYELQYIAGHEFAHHLCGHFDDNSMCKKAVLTTENNSYYKTIYNISQQHEFEADVASIMRPTYDSTEICNILEGALIWFLSLSLSELANDIVNPMGSFSYKTHPSADERYEYLLSNIDIPKEFNKNKFEKLKENAKQLKDWLVEDINCNFDIYDFFGSIYLDKPNTKWRGKELIDRVDY